MHTEYSRSPNRNDRQRVPQQRYRKLLRLPKIILITGGIFLFILLLIIIVVLLPLLVGLIGAIASGDVANWLQNAAKNFQDITKPITDIMKALQGLSGETGN